MTPPLLDVTNPPLQHSLKHCNENGGSLQRWPAGMQHEPLQPPLAQSLADAHVTPNGDSQPVKKLHVPAPPPLLTQGSPARWGKDEQIPLAGSLQFQQSGQQTPAQQEPEIQSNPVTHGLPPNCRIAAQVCVVPRQMPDQQSSASRQRLPFGRQVPIQTPAYSSQRPEQHSPSAPQRLASVVQHAPLTHCWLAPQTTPPTLAQDPQLFGSVCVSAQLPAQHVRPVWQSLSMSHAPPVAPGA